MIETKLKLRAQDKEDVEVISAVLQDAIAPVCDMAYEPDAKSFIMVVQRLRHEAGTLTAAERICCALTVNGVTSVQTTGFDPYKSDGMLDLLAILASGDGSHVNLVFAGEAKIRLTLATWSMAVEDFGEPWPALCNPCHENEAIAKGRAGA